MSRAASSWVSATYHMLAERVVLTKAANVPEKALFRALPEMKKMTVSGG